MIHSFNRDTVTLWVVYNCTIYRLRNHYTQLLEKLNTSSDFSAGYDVFYLYIRNPKHTSFIETLKIDRALYLHISSQA